jgi:hypothetical protein
MFNSYVTNYQRVYPISVHGGFKPKNKTSSIYYRLWFNDLVGYIIYYGLMT